MGNLIADHQGNTAHKLNVSLAKIIAFYFLSCTAFSLYNSSGLFGLHHKIQVNCGYQI